MIYAAMPNLITTKQITLSTITTYILKRQVQVHTSPKVAMFRPVLSKSICVYVEQKQKIKKDVR